MAYSEPPSQTVPLPMRSWSRSKRRNQEYRSDAARRTKHKQYQRLKVGKTVDAGHQLDNLVKILHALCQWVLSGQCGSTSDRVQPQPGATWSQTPCSQGKSQPLSIHDQIPEIPVGRSPVCLSAQPPSRWL